MISEFLTVFSQVLILFILISVGFIFGKTKIFNDNGIKSLTDLVLYIVCPSVVIDAFMREYEPKLLRNLLITAAFAFIAHLIPAVLSHILIHDKDKARERVLRFGSVFSNCGFMSLPLQQALIGDDGVFYGAVFVAVFNLLCWTYGLVLMSGDKRQLSPKKIITNPGIIGVSIGMIIFFCGINLPQVISKPVGYFAALNTPMPMFIIGYHLSKANILKALKERGLYITLALRLVVSPLLLFGIMYLFKIDSTIIIACVIASGAPTAAITTMFSTKFKRATELSVDLVSFGTLLSLITIPLIVAFVQSVV